ncbi:hypothetical protein, variant 2 [Aphanomyces astaci]|uniref:C-CAP/cofactor C-like domain-containing protein n=2 Tax=Aphanomyces astaci TaxID=112090 RepID=W4HCJ2_APHAT|nr:hypothetical protein, variant 2 [Aphanomyces astaci]ETV89009.1 hypothetical protein, variant 2 [Aphanomyces astaci]|eukprot:XP_009821409.1 hypothetical protein, variant 2 [Aphanomyces astaci]
MVWLPFGSWEIRMRRWRGGLKNQLPVVPPPNPSRTQCGRMWRKPRFNGRTTNAARTIITPMTKFLQASHRFWLVVVCLHHQIPILPSDDAQNKRDPSFLADEDYFLLEHVPLYKLATFLFLHMDKKSSKHRAKPSFDAVWRREDQPMTSPGSSGASSPVHLAAPISPSSPHSIGLKDRLESETHALSFVKANLDLLVSLVLDTSLTADDAIITAPQFDLLGVLFCGGASHVQQYPRLSAAYPKWQQPHQLASKVLKWLRTRLALNDVLYPRVGTCTPNNSIIATLHLNMPVSQDLEVEQPPSDNGSTRALIASLPRPVVISLVSKATVIKRADEFMRHCDVTIFGCHDAYIYVLGPLRHVSVVASCNCKVVLGPASGICTVDRCDNTTVSATCALLRVHNCLDSTFNVFTPRRSIFDGDNRGCYIGPFNAQYPHLRLHLVQSRLAYVPHSTGQWNKFVNLDTDEPSDASADAAVVLQTPLQFTEVCVPVKMDAVSPRVKTAWIGWWMPGRC